MAFCIFCILNPVNFLILRILVQTYKKFYIQRMEQKENRGEIVLYQPDGTLKLEVRLEDETVWLTQAQIAELFSTTRNNITMHISNVFRENELEQEVVCKDSLLTTQHGAIKGKLQAKLTKFYNFLHRNCSLLFRNTLLNIRQLL